MQRLLIPGLRKTWLNPQLVLEDHSHKLFMTGVGCVGWCVNTVRMDAAFAHHSRIAQHMAKPTVGAWEALLHFR